MSLGTTLPLHIFIVEDCEEVREMLHFYLKTLGHKVDSAVTGRAARAALEGARHDMLICDIQLPDTDGWEFMRTLGRARPAYAVAITAMNTTADRLKSLEAGFRYHVTKPFEPIALLPLLKQAARAKIDAAMEGVLGMTGQGSRKSLFPASHFFPSSSPDGRNGK